MKVSAAQEPARDQRAGQGAKTGRRRARSWVVPTLLAVTAVAVLAGCSSHKATSAQGSTGATTSASSSAGTGPTSSTTAGSATSSASAKPSTSAARSSSAGSGSINKTVPASGLKTKAPVSLSSPADFGNGVTAKVSGVKSVKATAQGPGEVSGPATEFVLSVFNGSGKTLDLSSVTVTVLDKAGTPFQQMSESKPLTGSAPNGASAHGTYVFAKPATITEPITISFNYSVEAPVVLFTGSAQ